MKHYYFEAVATSGELVKAETSQPSQAAVISEIRSRGLRPLSVKAVERHRTTPLFQRASWLTVKELTTVLQSIATLLESRVSLEKTLEIVAETYPVRSRIRNRIEETRRLVQAGQNLSQSIVTAGMVSPSTSRTVGSLIKAGENTGRLGENIGKAADLLSSQLAFEKKLRSALTYPAFVAMASLFTLIFMGSVIVPSFQDLFESAQKPLPTSLALLMDFATVAPPILLVVLTVVGAASRRKKNHHQDAGNRWSELPLKIPFIASIFVRRDMSSFCFLLAVMLEGGVPLTKAMQLSASSIKNQKLRRDTLARLEKIRAGQPLSSAFSDFKPLPPLFRQLTSVGEANGTLPAMLHQIAAHFRSSMQEQLEKLSAVISPLLILILGGMVGALMASVFGAILEINDLSGI